MKKQIFKLLLLQVSFLIVSHLRSQTADTVVQLKAELTNGPVVLNWNTNDSEFNHYFIERSTGNEFITLGNTYLKIIDEDTIRYNFKDEMTYNGLNYYRLRIENSNGYISYSNIVSIFIKKNTTGNIFPMPFTSELNVVTNLSEQMTLDFVITDRSGRVLNSTQITVTGGSQISKLPGNSSLPQGHFILSVIDAFGNILHSYPILKV